MAKQIFIHIGFGRCSTTTLQTNIFYKLSEKKNLNYIYGKTLLLQKTELKENYVDDLIIKSFQKKFRNYQKFNDNDILLSDESLISSTGGLWCPSTYDESLGKIIKFLGLMSIL